MKIVVLGAGAVGSVIGGLLKYHGEDVVLVRTNAEWVSAITERGLTISEEGKVDLRVMVPATTKLLSRGILCLVARQEMSIDTAVARPQRTKRGIVDV